MTEKHQLHSLPQWAAQGYLRWRNLEVAKNESYYKKLAQMPQSPQAMIIACSDSRIDPIALFDVRLGSLFTLRNIANIVPHPQYDEHSVGSALSFAIETLKIPSIIVLGHSGCAGVAACYASRSRQDQDSEGKECGVIASWISHLNPAYELIDEKNPDPPKTQLERLGVQISVENLRAYPIVSAAIDRQNLQLHGCWLEISTGCLWLFERSQGQKGSWSPLQ